MKLQASSPKPSRRRLASRQAGVLAALALLLLAGCDGMDPGAEPLPGDSDFVSADRHGGNDFGRGDDAEPAAGDGAAEGDGDAREVEEADVVRLVGDTLYVLNQYRGLQVVDLSSPASPRLVGMAPIFGYPVEMYVRGDRAYVVVSNYYDYWFDGEDVDSLKSVRGSQIRIVDIADPTRPTVLGGIDLPGHVTDTRIVGDVLYAVSNRWAWWWGYGTDDYETGTYVLSIDISDPGDVRQVDELMFELSGWTNSVHVTPRAIYVSSSQWNSGGHGYTTRIRYVDISDPAGAIAQGDEVVLNGYIRDRWQMDEHDDVLRVVSAPPWGNGIPEIHTFDVGDGGTLTRLGHLALTLPRPESLTAVRFDGERGYVVTFEQVDPLFVIDLSDPSSPLQRGELEMPGWLDHVMPRGDRLLALGRERVGDELQLTVSLFDVADMDAPELLDRVHFGGAWNWLPDSRDNFDKLFRVLDDLGLVLIPYRAYGFDETTGYWQHAGGVQLVDFDRDGLTLQGLVDHPGTIRRALVHEGRVVTVSNESLLTVDVSDRSAPFTLGELELARNVLDFVVLGNVGVQLSGDWFRGDTRLVVVPLSDPDLGEAIASVRITAPYGQMYVDGDHIYLTSRDWRTGMAKVTVVDFTTPTSPVVRGSVELPQSIAWWGCWWGWHGWGGDSAVQVGGDKLVFHSYRWYWRYWQDDLEDEHYDRLFVVDLSDKDAPRIASTVVLRDADWVHGLRAEGDLLYFSHSEWAGRDESGRSLTRFFLSRIDLSDPARPSALPKVNVPGVVVGLDGDVVYTLDWSWNEDRSLRNSFNALRLRGARAYLLDRLPLTGSPWGVYVDGKSAVMSTYRYWEDTDGWHNEQRLVALDLRDPRALRVASEVRLPETWGWLREVVGGRAFYDIGWQGGLLVYDVSDPDAVRLDRFQRHQGWIANIRISAGRAWIASGYYGLAQVPLSGVF
jgi:hypothetical protein